VDDEKPGLTLSKLDALVDILMPPRHEWMCWRGYVHSPKSLCFHASSPAIRTALRKRIADLADRFDREPDDG